ncbi:MAG: Gfo/Idh/MocA family oxidoreductase [Candidatus Competibacteraceae bacterium]|nr:Gfo/Idh/MocA family oxidoreductase [Candidatus Competibacteraceae bacterium]
MDKPDTARVAAKNSHPAGRPLGWGVIGCGWVAQEFAIPAIRATGRLVSVHDRDERTAATVGGAQTPLAVMLADPDVDAVYIATPNHAHAAAVIAAAAAGKAILCEKPLAANAADARAMIAAVMNAAVPFATAFDQRFHGAHRMIAGLIDEGRLGQLTHAAIRYACWLPADFAPVPEHDNWRIDPQRAGGGAVIDLAPHGIDLLACLSGARPTDVRVMLQHAVQPYAKTGAVDDGGLIAVRYDNGMLASLSVAYNCPDALPRRRLEIAGTHGMVIAQNTMGQTAGGTLTFFDETGHAHALDIIDDRPPFVAQIDAFNTWVMGGSSAGFAAPVDDLANHLLLIEGLAAASKDPLSCP